MSVMRTALASVRALVVTKRGKVGAALAVLATVIATSMAVLLARQRGAVSYWAVPQELWHVTLRGRQTNLNFWSDSPLIQSTIVLVTSRTTAQLIVYEGDRLLVLPRTVASGDTAYVDTGLVMTGQRRPEPIRLPLTLLTQPTLLHQLHTIGLTWEEYALSRADTLLLSLFDDANSFWLSGVGPLRVGGNSRVREALLSGERVSLRGEPFDVLTLTAVNAGGPPIFLVTLARGGSLAKPSHHGAPQEPLTLVIENSPEIEFRLPLSRDGWTAVFYKRKGADEEYRPQRPILSWDAFGFRTATTEEVSRALLVLGSAGDTVAFPHAFAVGGGSENQLTFNPSDGLRYKGVSNSVSINGENRVPRRVGGIPDEVLATLILGALSAVGSLAVWFLRLHPHN